MWRIALIEPLRSTDRTMGPNRGTSQPHSIPGGQARLRGDAGDSDVRSSSLDATGLGGDPGSSLALPRVRVDETSLRSIAGRQAKGRAMYADSRVDVISTPSTSPSPDTGS